MRPGGIVFLGPTGSGKTPLGELVETRGLWGKPCRHFDFGAQLRRLAASPQVPLGFDGGDRDFVRDVLQRGALLEDEHFGIAERILRAFLAVPAPEGGEWVVLNGLPRHEGQARALEPLVDVRAVICLSCAPEVVTQRIRRNTGGDRSGRNDDDLESVSRRLATYELRTAGLRDYYRAGDRRIEVIAVGVETTPVDVLGELEERS